MADQNPPRRNGPPRTGSLYWTKSGWRARIRIDKDGETSLQKSFDLETRDKQVARVKLRRLVKLNQPPDPEQGKAPITVAEYGWPWLENREALGIAAASYERRYFERVWMPALGPLPIGDVKKADVQAVLDAAAKGHIRPKPRKEGDEPEPYAKQSVVHMRGAIVRMFQSAWEDEIIPANKAALAKVPEIEGLTKDRAVLTDDEIYRLLAHPTVDAEIKLLLLISRTCGGLRAGDLNAMTWDVFSPGFETIEIVRRKTRKKKPGTEVIPVPERTRAFIDKWHEMHGRPVTGAVFPVRRGPRAGSAKKRSNMSYADRLRRELIRAGINRHALHHETARTLPVDFHSTRRAFGAALARANVAEETARKLGAWSDSKTKSRYTKDFAPKLPDEAALPELSTDHARLLTKPTAENDDSASFSERDTGLEPVTPSLGSGAAGSIPQESRGLPDDSTGGPERIQREPSPPCTDPMHGSERAAAEKALALLLRSSADALAAGFLSPGGQA